MYSRARSVEERRGALRLVAAPRGELGVVTIHQDARLYVANLERGELVKHDVERGRGIWVQVARGMVTLNGQKMMEGDGASAEEEQAVTIETDSQAEVLLFDLH